MPSWSGSRHADRELSTAISTAHSCPPSPAVENIVPLLGVDQMICANGIDRLTGRERFAIAGIECARSAAAWAWRHGPRDNASLG